MISDINEDGSGEINLEEFLDLMTVWISDGGSKEDIAKMFALFDEDKTGYITLKNLKRVAKELGETMGGAGDDADQDGQISVYGFYTIMTKQTFAWN